MPFTQHQRDHTLTSDFRVYLRLSEWQGESCPGVGTRCSAAVQCRRQKSLLLAAGVRSAAHLQSWAEMRPPRAAAMHSGAPEPCLAVAHWQAAAGVPAGAPVPAPDLQPIQPTHITAFPGHTSSYCSFNRAHHCLSPHC